jgi:hypothetical protein
MSRGEPHESANGCARFLCSLLNHLGSCKSSRDAGTGSSPDTFTGMERFFLALMVSGLLLAVAAATLFVATSTDDHTAAVMNLPSPPNAYLQKTKPRRVEQSDDRR